MGTKWPPTWYLPSCGYSGEVGDMNQGRRWLKWRTYRVDGPGGEIHMQIHQMGQNPLVWSKNRPKTRQMGQKPAKWAKYPTKWANLLNQLGESPTRTDQMGPFWAKNRAGHMWPI